MTNRGCAVFAVILAACGDDAPTAVSLEIEPAPFRIPAGTSAPIKANAIYSDGSITDVTAETTWTVDPTAAAIDSGSVRALRAGTVIVTADYVAPNDDELTAETSLIVTDAFLTRIQISPASLTLVAGTEQWLTATGVFSDDSMRDLTYRVSWASDANAVSISAQGLAHGVTPGSATISASFGTVQGTTSIVVTDAVMTALELTNPTTSALPIGRTRQLTATARFSDGGALDITDWVGWSVDPPTIAAIDTRGVVYGLALGTATLYATHGSFTAPAELQVGAPIVDHVVVFPTTVTIAKGQAHGFGAIGVFSNGTQRDITTEVGWSTSNATVASVSNTGVAQALNVGSAAIRASIGDAHGEATLVGTPP